MLDAAVTAIGSVLATLSNVDQVLTAPPAKLPDDRMFIVYPEPGEATPLAHGGSNRRVVYQADDDILVQYHVKAARDAMLVMEPVIRAQLEATRDALFAAGASGTLRPAIIALLGIRTDIYGDMSFWQPDTTCGFQIAVRVRHASEVGG